jgi:hypothetical protein
MNTTGETVGPPERSEKDKLFVNARGEVIDPSLELFDHPERGPVYAVLAERHVPRDLFCLTTLDTPEFANVVEHTVMVTASALTMAMRLRERGVQVDLAAVVDGAMAHDAFKPKGLAARLSREEEDGQALLEAVLREMGYTELAIGAAANTGRLPDRYLTDPAERMAAIQARGVEASIVGLADAMVRNSTLHTLEEARDANTKAKPDDASQNFFNNHWYPYYRDVITHLEQLAPGFSIADITSDTVFATMRDYINPQPAAQPAEVALPVKGARRWGTRSLAARAGVFTHGLRQEWHDMTPEQRRKAKLFGGGVLVLGAVAVAAGLYAYFKGGSQPNAFVSQTLKQPVVGVPDIALEPQQPPIALPDALEFSDAALTVENGEHLLTTVEQALPGISERDMFNLIQALGPDLHQMQNSAGEPLVYPLGNSWGLNKGNGDMPRAALELMRRHAVTNTMIES